MSDDMMLWCQACGAPAPFRVEGLTLAPRGGVVLRSPRWPRCRCGHDSYASCKPLIFTEGDRKFLRSLRIGHPQDEHRAN